MPVTSASFIRSVADVSRLPQDNLPHVACLGRSNVGKSTLINTLTGIRDLARASATPGRTQLVNVFKINDAYYFDDLPGYGFAQLSKKERERLESLIYDYLTFGDGPTLALLVVDAAVGATDLDEETAAFLQSANISFIIIANKFDRLSRTAQQQAMQSLQARFPSVRVFPHASVTGQGAGPILDAISRALHA